MKKDIHTFIQTSYIIKAYTILNQYILYKDLKLKNDCDVFLKHASYFSVIYLKYYLVLSQNNIKNIVKDICIWLYIYIMYMVIYIYNVFFIIFSIFSIP